MNRPRTAAVLLVAVLAAGASACSSARGGVPDTGSVESDTYIQASLGTSTFNLRTVEHISVRRDTLRGVTGDVLPHVIAAYREKGIPVTTVEPESRTIGTVESLVRKSLDGTRLSRYLSCGSTVMGDRADRYEVYLTVLTQVENLDVGTGVYTHVRATAVPGARSGNPVHCQTTGRLEQEIIGRIQWEIMNAA